MSLGLLEEQLVLLSAKPSLQPLSGPLSCVHVWGVHICACELDMLMYLCMHRGQKPGCLLQIFSTLLCEAWSALNLELIGWPANPRGAPAYLSTAASRAPFTTPNLFMWVLGSLAQALTLAWQALY